MKARIHLIQNDETVAEAQDMALDYVREPKLGVEGVVGRLRLSFNDGFDHREPFRLEIHTTNHVYMVQNCVIVDWSNPDLEFRSPSKLEKLEHNLNVGDSWWDKLKVALGGKK